MGKILTSRYQLLLVVFGTLDNNPFDIFRARIMGISEKSNKIKYKFCEQVLLQAFGVQILL